jgi:hypothetical protein
MTPDELALLKRAQNAIDMLFGMLIVATRLPRSETAQPFFPSQCGEPWEAMVALHTAIHGGGGEDAGR